MYGLPQTTEVRKQLPKKAIYAKFDLKPSQRESFDADISTLYIVGVVSTKTLSGIAEGENVKEIYVLSLQLKRKTYNPKNISLLSKLIPHKIVIALQYEDEVQFAVYYTKLISSAWQSAEEATLMLSGLNFDSVWENIVKYVGNICVKQGESLAEQIKVDEEQLKLLTQIKVLEQKMANEKQPRRKREYFEQIKKIKTYS